MSYTFLGIDFSHRYYDEQDIDTYRGKMERGKHGVFTVSVTTTPRRTDWSVVSDSARFFSSGKLGGKKTRRAMKQAIDEIKKLNP